MITGWIFIKIKSKDIIKFLISQFDLIMGQIKFNYVWELIWVQLKDLIRYKDLIIL
jgi:hypothetical protein